MNVQTGRFAWFVLASLPTAPGLGPGPLAAQAIPSSHAGLVVSEILYNPQGSDDFEFVEFYNAGSTAVDLTGYKLVKDDKGDGLDFTFAAGTLQPGSYVVVTEDQVQFNQRYLGADSSYFFAGISVAGQWKGGLGNGGEKLQLQAPDGTLILKFSYGVGGNWPLQADGMGSSLELLDPASIPADDLKAREKYLETPGNWRASREFHGNPGRPGQPPDRSVLINEVLSNTDGQLTDTIELYNPTAVQIDVGGWFLSDSTTFDKFRIPAGTQIAPKGFATFDERDFNPNGGWNPDAAAPGQNDFSLSGAKGDEVWLVQADDKGNAIRVLDKVSFGPAFSGVSFGRWPDGGPDRFLPGSSPTLGAANAAPFVGSVVLSEIQYNPGSQTNADNLEFIEVRNTGNASVALSGWTLDGGVEFAFAEGTELSADGYLLVVGFDVADAAMLQAFRDHYGLTADAVSILGPWKGGLSNSGETLCLKRRDTTAEKIVDEGAGQAFHPLVIEDVVPYSDGGQWPGRPDGSGQTLERKDPAVWGGVPENWRASKEFKGNPGRAGLGTARHVLITEILANSGIDGGPKIDAYVLDGNYLHNPSQVPFPYVTNYLDAMRDSPFHFSLFHFAGPDSAGHAAGWGSDAQKTAIEAVDAELGRIFELVENEAALAGKTVLLLTSDHGGGGGWTHGHTLPTHKDNFTIPFYVWGPGVTKGDLYDLNATTRTAPDATANPAYSNDTASMPIRNGTVANLALSLLQLPPVPGSWINYKQDLSVGQPSGVEQVIAISVDGLRPKEIQDLGQEKLPNFYRFRNEGAWTDNARTNVTITLTLPNHTSMLTGRGAADVDGLGQGHRQSINTYVGGTLHQNIGGEHMASVFDVVHDNGLRTSLRANKSKFDLFKASYQAVDTGTSDTIELYNPTGQPVDLGGWYLSDSQKTLQKFRIPDGTVLPSGGFVVFTEKDFNPGFGANATDFSLSGSKGEGLFLSQSDAAGNIVRLVDSLDFGPSPEGVTIGRGPDGTGAFRFQAEPTFGKDSSGYRVGSLLINEIMYRPEGGDDLEYVELYNAGSAAVDLSGWQLDGVGDIAFQEGWTIQPGAVAVLLRFDPANAANAARKTAFEAAYGVALGSRFYGGYTGGLGDDGDSLKLYRLGRSLPREPNRFPAYLEEEAAYSATSPWPELKVGESLHRSGPQGWGGVPGNWSPGGPTPGSLVAQNTFQEWAISKLPDVEAPSGTDDADGDRIPNLLEFALGMDPSMPDPGALPVATHDFSGDNVTLTYSLDRAAGGVDVRVQYVEVLGQVWKDLAQASFPTRTELVGVDGTVETRRLLLPASHKVAFLRVVVEQ